MAHSPDDKKLFWGLRGQKLHYAVGGLAGITFMLLGYDQGVMSSLLTLPSFLEVFPETDTTTTTGSEREHNSTIQGATIGLYEIGCLLGALSCIWVGDRLGRRKTLFTGACIMIVGAIIQTASYGLVQLIIGRIIAGVGNGLNTATVPTWQSECAPAAKRGQLMMIQGALITAGIAIAYWLDFAFFWASNSSVSWRGPVAFQIVFAIIIATFVLKLPESPRWLIKKGRLEEARRNFAMLMDKPLDDPEVEQDMREVQAALRVSGKSSFSDLFRNGPQRHAHRAFLGYTNQCFQQITGINLITYYAGTIYENNLGLDPTLSRILAACNGTEYALASWIPVWLIERVGRRKLMLSCAIGQACTMAILAGTGYLVQTQNNKGAAIAAAAFLFIFNTFFAIGWLGMSWLYPAEVTPLQIRAAANGVSTASNWSFNFLIVMITPVAFSTIGFHTYTVFAIINFCIAILSYFLFPETAGRSLEQMDVVFEQANGIYDAVKIARDQEPMFHDDLERTRTEDGLRHRKPSDRPGEKSEKPEVQHRETSASDST